MSVRRPHPLLLLALLSLGCATRQIPPPAAAPTALHATPVNVAALYGDVYSGSIVDRALLVPGLLKQLHLPDRLLDVSPEEVPIEAWGRKLLFAEVARREGTTVLRPGALDEPPPIPATASLQSVVFQSGTDELEVVVTHEEDELQVAPRRNPETKSLCGNASWPVHFVQFQAVAQLPNGTVVGFIDETMLVEPDVSTFEAQLPGHDHGDFCASLMQQFADHPPFQPTDVSYQRAGVRVLSVLDLLRLPSESELFNQP